MGLADKLNWRIAVAENSIISLDFDGVIHNYTGWDGDMPTGEPVPGALEAVRWMISAGFDLFILSTRAHDNPAGAAGISEWLLQHGFPPIRIANGKEHADLYVDDRGFRFEGPQSWGMLVKILASNPKPKRWGQGSL